MDTTAWKSETGTGPLVACAIHAGDGLREEVGQLLRLSAERRLYEEDPYTDGWTSIAPTRLVGNRSRFEVDLNRPRDKAVYLGPQDAWGLDVWKTRPTQELVDRSLAIYNAFYAELSSLLDRLVTQHERVVVFDLHSYNHRRDGAAGSAANPEQNPEINLGTRTMDRQRWSGVIDRVLAELREAQYLDRHLDARENIKFFGGHMASWCHQTYPESVCVLSVEVKKIFMDEWTGALDEPRFQAIGGALQRAAAGALDELENWDRASITT